MTEKTKKVQWVQIHTERPHQKQFDGAKGRICAVSTKGLIYVRVGKYTPCFFENEVTALEIWE